MDEIQIAEPTQPTKATRNINRFIVLSLVIIALGLGVFLRWSFAKTEVLVINNNPFPSRVVDDPSGQTGGVVFLDTDYCKNIARTGKIRMSYVSATREVFLPVAEEKLSTGCKKAEVPVVIPKSLISDTYRIKFRVTYNVNPVKSAVVTEFESKPFTVVGAKNE